MNKKAKTSGAVVLLGVVAVVIVVILVYAVFLKSPQSAFSQSNEGDDSGTYISTGSTTVRYAVTDSITGASVTPASSTKVGEGGAFTTNGTAYAPGDKLYVLLSHGGYHPAYSETPFTVAKAPVYEVQMKMKANGTVAIAIFNTNNILTTSTGTANETNAANGYVFNQVIRFTGTTQKETTPMRCILESEAGSNTTKIELTGLGAKYVGTGKPNFYSLLGSGSSTWVYDIDPIVGSEVKTGGLVITSGTGKTLAHTGGAVSRVKVTCYTKEYFQDPNTGKIEFGIEDSAGTQKSINAPTITEYFT